jgi:hypothetical protein
MFSFKLLIQRCQSAAIAAPRCRLPPPAAMRFMSECQRAQGRGVSAASHVVMVSRPNRVGALIREAAR